MIDIENKLCVRSVINVTPFFQIEREPWGGTSNLKTVSVGVYMCSCSFISDE